MYRSAINFDIPDERPAGVSDVVQKTFFDQPIVCGFLRVVSGWILKRRGWRLEGELPTEKKFVAILIGHTSNWDFPIGLSVALQYRVRLFWLGKHSIFAPPFGPLMRWLGGIATERGDPGNLVAEMSVEFGRHENIVLGLAPEGTRAKVEKWKTGFYRIAQGADVPVVLAYLDYARKVGGPGPTIYLSGDQDADLARMRAFYGTITSKYPEKSM